MGGGGLVEVDVKEVVEVVPVETSEEDQGAADEPSAVPSS